MMTIRTATQKDREAIRKIHLLAFPAEEREIVAQLALDLLAEATSPNTVSLVAETDAVVAGHIAFSPLGISNQHIKGYILAPLGVKPDAQKQHIGTHLVETGLQQLSSSGVNIVLVYGDPGYYSQFGFRTDTARHFTPPYRLQYPEGWQAVILNAYDFGESQATITCATPLCNQNLW